MCAFSSQPIRRLLGIGSKEIEFASGENLTIKLNRPMPEKGRVPRTRQLSEECDAVSELGSDCVLGLIDRYVRKGSQADPDGGLDFLKRCWLGKHIDRRRSCVFCCKSCS